ncbi:class A beta-lactamase-related serine hydrolase [Oleiharenicola lentus]|uniref:Class A beta-lactamase-related serine hydrolase n=1 Tax=Oleiharenicola lentus TaxID=2508720 RepID=A0A4Q1C6U0_9BACT|nr:serine hydrolase domain-containing protein [Oleiharenicola lentus]RXK54603.1 class A beta-lactamase-related serine hydrolase [Oleiharenicola lentus]
MKTPRLVFLFLSLLWLARAADPAALGFDPVRLQRLDQVIERDIAAGQLAGAVMIVKRDGQDAVLKAYGANDVENKVPMRTDAIFRIASMSKAVTTVAALMLYEEGRFLLNDPVGKFIPEFSKSVVAVPPPPGSPADLKYVTVPAKRAITIRDLMTHTAGLGYGWGLVADDYKKANLQGWYLMGHDETLASAMKRLATLPLSAQPGEAFEYGYGTDLLGHLVEVVSGMPLDRFVQERILGPLRMPDTGFFLPKEKAARLAVLYGLEGGKLVRKEDATRSDFIDGPRKLFSGGAGLYSTASDYGRFLQMLLNGGELDGVRLLSPRTVALMHENHTRDLFKWDTKAFGLGFWVNQDPGAQGELMGEGAYGWGSAYFPQYFVDPKERLIGLLMCQLNPDGGNKLNQRFKVTIYQALK